MRPAEARREGVDHDEQLHEVVVDRGAGGLNHEDVGAADGLIDGDEVLPIGERAHLGVAQLGAHLLADGFRQGLVGVAAENFDILPVCDHVCTSSLFYLSEGRSRLSFQ